MPPEPLTAVMGWAVDPSRKMHAPAGVTHAVLDTPGGMHGFALARVANHADAILIPVCNSAFDRESSAACWAELKTFPRIASGRCRVAVVGMRLDGRTKGDEVLRAWAAEQGLPYLGALRETQAYVRCIELGVAIFDLPPAKVADDLAQWTPILDWLAPVLEPAHLRKPAAQPLPTVAAPTPIVHRMPRTAPPVLKSRPAPSLSQRLVSWLTAPLAPRAE